MVNEIGVGVGGSAEGDDAKIRHGLQDLWWLHALRFFH